MNELLIVSDDNSSSKNYGIYYTINNRFYLIYTNKDKDEKNYVIMHIAKVLKEVNNTPEGIVPTGKYIGIDITDASEWETAIVNINEVISNKQKNTPTSVTFLPITEINGIGVKSSRTFKLREDVVEEIISKGNNEEVKPMVDDAEMVSIPTGVVEQPVVPEPIIEPLVEQPVNSESITEPLVEQSVISEPVTESLIDQSDIQPAVPNVETSVEPAVNDEVPTLAPNPFETASEPTIAETETKSDNLEQTAVNPYDTIKQQREEEMVNTLATDDMKDIVSSPVIPIDKLEEKENINNVSSTQQATLETNNDANNGDSFVDSIVADVSNIVDNPVSSNTTSEEIKNDKDYEQLYNDALEKTVELEKELTELHNKINNIKNIVE